ncbi:death-associated inhibitor of apoptosis 2-like [Littorina saxatilis]|uniref:death-associated inhibitor of apoptosis 2-like n=1 Tax=Littorina saxatilis TaxID=31220 RepID=UPI0038B57026
MPPETKKSPESKTVPEVKRDRSIYVEDTQGTPKKSKTKPSSLKENKRTDKQGKSPVNNRKFNTDPKLIEDEKNDEMSYFPEMQSANLRLRQRVICRLCQAKPVDTIFLPCGHICTCEQCAAAIQHCCVCNEQIMATALVHME